MSDRPELKNIDRLSSLPIQRAGFDGPSSELASQVSRSIEEGQSTYTIGEENPLHLVIRLGVYKRNDPGLPGLKNSFWSFEKRVWEPEVNRGLKRHLRDAQHYPKPQRHDIDDFAVVPEGAQVGFFVEGSGGIDRLLSIRGWGERGKLDVYKGQRYTVEDGKKIDKDIIGRSREGIGLYGAIKEFKDVPTQDLPLRSRQNLGRFGEGDRTFAPMPRPFSIYERDRGYQEPERFALARFSSGEAFYPDGANFSSPLPVRMGKNPRVIKLDVFEGTEDWIQEEQNFVKGYNVPHMPHDPNSMTERCPACGFVGMAEDDFYFEQYSTNISKFVMRPKHKKKVAQIRIALVTPEYAKLDIKGQVVNSCQSCFPAPCHHMHQRVEIWKYCKDCQNHNCLKHSFYEHTIVCNDHSKEFKAKLLEHEKDLDAFKAERNRFMEQY